ncbi:MAG: glycosyltransferase family 39 protein [Syntrophorhabdaceae bacterium]|nr:glycosyltransferase family 39 protein [Syntrophorhabdaceae bacterium]
MFSKIKEIDDRYLIAVLLCTCALVFFINLQSRDFWAPDEGDFAQIVKELNNDFIVPHLNNIPYGEKPPLFYYLAYLFKVLFFFFRDEVSLRLVSGIWALILVFFFFITIKKYEGKVHGFISCIILVTSPLFYWQARYLQVDMVFSVFVALSLIFFYWYIKGSRTIFYYLFFLAIGLAFMTKGPLTLALVCPVILFTLILKKDLRPIKSIHTVSGAFLFIAIIMPWYLLVYMKEGLPFLYENILRQNFLRFFDAWSHKRPFYYYFTTLPLDFFPWSLFLPLGIYNAFKNIRKDDLMRYSLIWFLWMFVFLSMSSGKISKYMLPLLPASAYMVASVIQKEDNLYNKLVSLFISLAFFVLGVLLFVFRKDAYTELAGVRVFLGCVCILTSLTMFFFIKTKRIVYSFFVLASGIIIVYLIANIAVYEKVNIYKSPRPISEKIKSLTEKGIPWVYYGSIRGVYVYYADRFATHINEHDTEGLAVFKDKNREFFILTRKRDLDEADKALGGVKIVYEHRVGDTQMVILQYKRQ